MRCETCGFDLPEDWSPTTAGRLLCVPCARSTPDRHGPLTAYRALPPHVPAGARKEVAK